MKTLRILSFILGVRARAPFRQLLNESLTLKSTFDSLSPPTVASGLRALPVPSRRACLCTYTHAHVSRRGRWSGDRERGHAGRSVYTPGSATTGRPLWTLQGRGKGYCWVHRISKSRQGSYPQCRPITSSTNVLWWLQETDTYTVQMSLRPRSGATHT